MSIDVAIAEVDRITTLFVGAGEGVIVSAQERRWKARSFMFTWLGLQFVLEARTRKRRIISRILVLDPQMLVCADRLIYDDGSLRLDDAEFPPNVVPDPHKVRWCMRLAEGSEQKLLEYFTEVRSKIQARFTDPAETREWLRVCGLKEEDCHGRHRIL